MAQRCLNAYDLSKMNEDDFQYVLANNYKMREYYSRLLDTSLLNVIDVYDSRPLLSHSTAMKKKRNKSSTISSKSTYKTNKNKCDHDYKTDEYNKLHKSESIIVGVIGNINKHCRVRSYCTTIPTVFRRFNVCYLYTTNLYIHYIYKQLTYKQRTDEVMVLVMDIRLHLNTR